MANFVWIEVDGGVLLNIECIKAISEICFAKYQILFQLTEGGDLMKTFGSEKERNEAFIALRERLEVFYFPWYPQKGQN